MRIIPGTIADPAYVEALERHAPVRPGDPTSPPTWAPKSLRRQAELAQRAVEACFPAADDLGIVATDALYESLAALTFVAHLAEEANL